jgi:hypothetical protein
MPRTPPQAARQLPHAPGLARIVANSPNIGYTAGRGQTGGPRRWAPTVASRSSGAARGPGRDARRAILPPAPA